MEMNPHIDDDDDDDDDDDSLHHGSLDAALRSLSSLADLQKRRCATNTLNRKWPLT